MKKLALSLLVLSICLNFQAQTINWSTPIDVSSEDFGNKANRIALNSSGEPMVLFGTTGANEGLYLCIMTDGVFSDPISVTSDSNVFLSETEGPRMAVSGDKIAVGYQISGEWETGGRVVISNDGGLTWSDPIVLNADASVDFFMPCVGFDPYDSPFVGLKWGANPTLEGIMTFNAFLGEFNSPVDGSASMMGDAVCECCPSDPFSYDGVYYNIVRNNNNNIRDMWLAVSDDGITWDESLDIDPTNWLTNTCPATGASHTITDNGTLVTTYMSAPNGSRVYYSAVDLASLELTSSGMIDPTAEHTENNPVVSSSGEWLATAWERNSGGYDIMVAVSNSGPEGFSSGVTNATDALDLSGHKRNPGIAISGNVIHLTFKSPTAGVVKYMRGEISGESVQELPNDFMSFNNSENAILCSEKASISVFNLSGKLLIERETEPGQTISLNELPSGIYTVVGTSKIEGINSQQSLKVFVR